jgi:hypothetical protein
VSFCRLPEALIESRELTSEELEFVSGGVTSASAKDAPPIFLRFDFKIVFVG